MKTIFSPIYPILSVLVLLGLILTACVGGVASQPEKPVATITTPPSGSSFEIGQPVVIQFSAADVKGVAQVELSIDGQPVRVEQVNPPVNSFVANYVWTPDLSGSHVIELHAFSVEGTASDPVQIIATITEAADSATTAAPVIPTTPMIGETPTLSVAVETPTLIPPVPITFTPTPEPVQAMVTANVGLNVRSGPGTNFPVIGKLIQGQSVPIVGRNGERTWWQIQYPPGTADRGWVSGGAQFSTASNAEGVPVAEAPPPPTPAATATNTPSPLKPTIHSFTADRYTIASNEKVVLRWDLSNAREAYLRYDDKEEGVVAPGEKTVSPDEDTVYTLVARNDAGETTAQVTIKVGATPTPVPVLRDGKTRIVNDQSIDFDQGVIQQGSGGAGADFYWDGQQKRFYPQSGSSGTLTGRAFENMSFEDCRSASYGQPLPQIDPAGRISGCYKTNEGRYGKFWVSEWDASGNLTIVWLTWSK